jgi:hypothetical protein
MAPHSMGRGRIVSIFGQGYDVFGRRYICYHAKHGTAGTISHSLVEGLIDWPVNDHHTYQERCAIRARMEPGPLRDHYGYLIDSAGRRIGGK